MFIDVYTRDRQLWLYVSDGDGSSMEAPLDVASAELLALKITALARQLGWNNVVERVTGHPPPTVTPLPPLGPFGAHQHLERRQQELAEELKREGEDAYRERWGHDPPQ